MTRLAAVYAWSLVVLTAAPGIGMVFGVEREGYPFSTYPMFSSLRPRLEQRPYVVGIHADGREVLVPSTFWKKRSHFNEGWRAIVLAARSRPKRAALCEAVAENLGESRASRFRGIERVELRSGRFDTEDMFANGNHAPARLEVLATCATR